MVRRREKIIDSTIYKVQHLHLFWTTLRGFAAHRGELTTTAVGAQHCSWVLEVSVWWNTALHPTQSLPGLAVPPAATHIP